MHDKTFAELLWDRDDCGSLEYFFLRRHRCSGCQPVSRPFRLFGMMLRLYVPMMILASIANFFSSAPSNAETIRIRCSNTFFNIDTYQNILESQGRTNRISWTYDGEWIRLTFPNQVDKLAFSRKTGYVIQNGKQIDARCVFQNPQALAKLQISPTANLRTAFIALPVGSRKLIQEIMSYDRFYNSTIDGLWGSGTEDALGRYKTYFEGLTGQTYSFATPIDAARFLEAIIASTYEGDECDGCDATLPPQPGFNCARATTLDERTICATPKLIELDNLLNEGFRQVTLAKGRQVAQIVARTHLDRRKQCGANSACIEEVQSEVINRFIALGAKVNLPAGFKPANRSSAQSTVAKKSPVDYIGQEEATYVVDALKQFATDHPNELTVDFVINLNALRQAVAGAWSQSKAQAFQALLKDSGSTDLLAQRIAAARSDYASKKARKEADARTRLGSKLEELKAWVLNNATSEQAAEIAQYLKRAQDISSTGDLDNIQQLSERADRFLAAVNQSDFQNTPSDASSEQEKPKDSAADEPLVHVGFSLQDQAETVGDAFDQYSARKGQILIPVRLTFQPDRKDTPLSSYTLSIELGTETGARYPVNESASRALAAQLGMPDALAKSMWAPGEPIFLVFEIPRVNAVANEIFVAADGIKFKSKRE